MDLRSVYCEKLYDVETLGKIGDVSKKMEYVLEKNLKVKWYYSCCSRKYHVYTQTTGREAI